MLRSLLIIPKLNNKHYIEDIRKKYDPLYDKVPPHITLVFPFESEMSNSSLINHIEKQLIGIKPFCIALQSISYQENGFIFWEAVKAIEISDLHDKLYTGILASFLNKQIPYIPHITLGKLEKYDALNLAKKELLGFNLVEECFDFDIILEAIDEDGGSLVIKEFSIIKNL